MGCGEHEICRATRTVPSLFGGREEKEMNENSSSCFKVMTDTDRDHLIGNIVAHLGGAHERIQLRQTAPFYKADLDYDTRVAKDLDLDLKEVERLAVMSQDERVKATSSSLYKPKTERKGEQR